MYFIYNQLHVILSFVGHVTPFVPMLLTHVYVKQWKSSRRLVGNLILVIQVPIKIIISYCLCLCNFIYNILSQDRRYNGVRQQLLATREMPFPYNMVLHFYVIMIKVDFHQQHNRP